MPTMPAACLQLTSAQSKRQYESHTDHSSRQMHSNFDDCQHSAVANAVSVQWLLSSTRRIRSRLLALLLQRDRDERLAQIHAQYTHGDASDPETTVA